jgi:hypothetical protein
MRKRTWYLRLLGLLRRCLVARGGYLREIPFNAHDFSTRKHRVRFMKFVMSCEVNRNLSANAHQLCHYSSSTHIDFTIYSKSTTSRDALFQSTTRPLSPLCTLYHQCLFHPCPSPCLHASHLRVVPEKFRSLRPFGRVLLQRRGPYPPI